MVDLNRRRFLRGDFSGGKKLARIGPECLAFRNVSCRNCGDACEEQAIRFRPVVMAAAQPEVDPDKCTGCGACVAPCPVQAIRIA